MEDVEPCGFCRDWWQSEEIRPGLQKLKEFRGYTVDMRLKELRNINLGLSTDFISFDSPKGQRLLKQMHKHMIAVVKAKSII